MIPRLLIAITIVAGVLTPATIARAHSQLIGSNPEANETVAQAPSRIKVDYSEPPISADDLVVEDGCGVDVVTSAEVEGKDIVAELSEGQPGQWQVSSRVISGVDGHETTDGFRFSVRGTADCAAATQGPGREREEGDSPLPLILVLAGATAIVVTGAFFLRRSS